MKCKSKYKASDLKARLKIERKIRTNDGQGGFTLEWIVIGEPRAQWIPLEGGEQWNAMRVASGIRVNSVIRFRGDEQGRPYYSKGDRITYKGRQYDIESLIDVDNEHRWLKMGLAPLPDGMEYSDVLEAQVAPPSPPGGNWELEAGGTWELEAGGNWELE